MMTMTRVCSIVVRSLSNSSRRANEGAPASEWQAAACVAGERMSGTVEARDLVRTSERQRAKWQAAACVAGER